MLTLENALAPFAGKYSQSFLASMTFCLTWETVFQAGHDGDYAFVHTEDVPGDGGGQTRYGVDAADHPGVDIGELTLAGALAIYHGGEWAAVRGDDMPPDVAMAVFDAAVNVGIERASKWLQEAVGAQQDGKIGPLTLAAVAQAQTGLAAALVDRYRTAYYEELADEYPRDKEFEDGWLNRTNALEAAISDPTSTTAATA